MNIFKKMYCRVFQFCFKLVIPLLPYKMPQILDSLNEIPNILVANNKSSAFLVATKSIIRNGLIDSLKMKLSEKNIKYVIYDGTIPNPTIDNVEDAREIYLANNCDSIIAVGGGSVMDLSKVLGARIARPKKSVEKMKGLLHVRKKIPLLITCPSTSGSGSEVTIAAVITDSKTHDKYAVSDFSLMPNYSVLDPNLTASLPKNMTSTTGMDALTHAVEAFIGNSTTKETRKKAIDSVKLIYDNLYECYINGSNLEARKNMLLGSHYAGIAFTKSYVGYVHAIAHTLGGEYLVAHGFANAVILPKVLRKYGKNVHKKLAILAKEVNLADSNDSNTVASEKFISWIEELNKKMDIPDKIKELKESYIEFLAKKAAKEANPLYPVPRLLDSKELIEIYKDLIWR